MEQSAIFDPFFTQMLLTFVVWLYMYSRRIPFIRRNNLTPQQLTPLEFARLQPPAVSNPSDNLKNLFELPVLFYVSCLYLYMTAQVDGPYLAAAWFFVVFRILHSVLHCTLNIVLLRFGLYLLSSLGLWFIILRAASTQLQS